MTNTLAALSLKFLPLLTRGQGSCLSTLIYHRVVPRRDPMNPSEPTVEEFDWQMRLLRKHFNPLPLVEAVDRLHAGDLPERAVCVTFDDGYRDNAVHALPVLERYGIPATVFVSTGFLDGGRMWNDSIIESLRRIPGDTLDLTDDELGRHSLATEAERLTASETIIRRIKHLDPDRRMSLVDRVVSQAPALPEDLMMSSEQVQLLVSRGVTIGAHTVTHPILASVTDDVAQEEIGGSKQFLESLLQEEVRVFAYPNGKPGQDYKPAHRDMVERAGFALAVSTHWGVGVPGSDRFQLPRFTPWDRDELRFTVRLLLNYRRMDSLVDH